ESLCGLNGEQAKAALQRIRIEHVYGQLGALDDVKYGDFAHAVDAAKGIRTIRLEPDRDVQERLGKIVRGCTYINFIGFGFDDDNIALLGPENFTEKRVFSTTLGMSARTRTKVRQQLGVKFNVKEAPELTAVQL